MSWWRWYRIQRRHQKALDRHLEPPSPWVMFGEPLDWHAIHMDRTVLERDLIGQELLDAGWLP